jgi:hypothetical protein
MPQFMPQDLLRQNEWPGLFFGQQSTLLLKGRHLGESRLYPLTLSRFLNCHCFMCSCLHFLQRRLFLPHLLFSKTVFSGVYSCPAGQCVFLVHEFRAELADLVVGIR